MRGPRQIDMEHWQVIWCALCGCGHRSWFNPFSLLFVVGSSVWWVVASLSPLPAVLSLGQISDVIM